MISIFNITDILMVLILFNDRTHRVTSHADF